MTDYRLIGEGRGRKKKVFRSKEDKEKNILMGKIRIRLWEEEQKEETLAEKKFRKEEC